MRKAFRTLCMAVTLAAALLVPGAGSALAINTHVFTTSFGSAGSGAGQLALARVESSGLIYNLASGVAVNNLTHDVYVADTENERVDQFSSSGLFIRAWGWGVADGLPAFETCTLSCQVGTAGSGAGQLNRPDLIAVDNSGGPSEGDVYVADHTHTSRVSKFSAAGAYISTNDGSGATFPLAGPFGAIAGIAVDGAGDLWVSVYQIPRPPFRQPVFEFAQNGAFVTGWEPHREVGAQGITVDSATNLYLLSGAGTVAKFASSGNLFGDIGPGEINPTGLAADTTTGDLYVDEEEGTRIFHYSLSCEPARAPCAITDTFGSGQLSHAGGLAVDATNGTVYAADGGDQRIAVFGSTPDVTTGQPTNRTPTGARLSGSVEPRNTAVSDCHFDYVNYAEYNPAEQNPYAAGGTAACLPAPGSGSGAVAVHADISGLTPGTPYHFRLEATNANGTSFGSDQSVPGTPPVITSTGAANVASGSADLRARINPGGGETTYRFEYGTSTSYGADVPVPDGDIGSGALDVPVNRHIQGLAAGTVYHYRVVAQNSLGSVAGPDHTILTQPNGGSGVDTCANAAVRAEQHSVALPDCRAYEQVSPPEKDGGAALGLLDYGHAWQGALDGAAISYTSGQPFGDARAGAAVISPYLASRAQGGWSSHGLLPPQAPGDVLPWPKIIAYSPDLSRAILLDGGGGGFGGGQDNPPLVPGEPANNENLFLRDNSSDSYQLVDVTPPGVTPAGALFDGASTDLSHVVFSENAQLTADSPPAGENAHLFEWSGGAVRLVGLLPDGTPVPASLETSVPGMGNNFTGRGNSHAVSGDGSRIFFQTRFHESLTLYLRQDGVSTVQVDASRGSGSGGGGRFAVASGDGSKAFFTDDASAGLTSDTVPGSGVNLYRYEAGTGALKDLTPVDGAEVQGVVGASEDGSYVYFVANGSLASGATPGRPNLYLFHEGVSTFIATLNPDDEGDWRGTEASSQSGRGGSIVSRGGLHVAFRSVGSLTGFDNVDVNTGLPDTEVFLYDVTSGRLSCASCNPSGAAPIGGSTITVPTSGLESDEIQAYAPRYLSDSGRLFFNSMDALVPRDSNGTWDVYEYEPGGVGGCGQPGGCVALISSGTSAQHSEFLDASLTGEDVFFTTSEQLVAQDTDQGNDIYDARVGGGIASQNQLLTGPCSGESCKAPPVGQFGEQTPGSSSFVGVGNQLLVGSLVGHQKHAKGKRHARKKRAKKKRHSGRGRRANYNRGGVK